MVYFSALLLLSVLTLFCFYRWVKGRRPSAKTVERHLNDARRAIAIGDWDAAHRSLLPLLAKSQPLAETAALHARILTSSGRLDEALNSIEKAIDSLPESPALHRERGQILLSMSRPNEALEAFSQCRPNLNDDIGRIDLATALYHVGSAEEAWEELRDYVVGSQNGRLLALAGDCQFQLRNYPLAVTLYQQAQHLGWMNQCTVARAGHSLQQSGQFVEAARHFRQLLEADSCDVVATLGLGTCYEARGLYRRALIIYQIGGAWDCADPRILRQAGICAVYTQQYDYAELYLMQALDQGCTSPQALAFLGYSLEAQRRWKEAEQIYMRLVEEFPDHPAGYRALAWIYGVGLSQELSQVEGLSVAHRAIELFPDATAWELLSACEARAGNFDRAHHIQEQLSARSSDVPTRRRRRQAMRMLRKGRPLDEQHVIRAQVA